MNRLMMMNGGSMPRYMDVEGGAGGEGGGGTGGEGGGAPSAGGESGVNGDPSPKGEKSGEGEGAPAAGEGEPKPFLGGGEGEGNGGEGKGGEQPKPATEEDYLKTVVKDESVLGTDKNVQFDQSLVKAMIPEAQKLGVTPDTMAKLANAFAKAQIDQGKQALQERLNYFNKMKEESLKKYTPQDFAQINAGIDHWFKPNGVMNNVIRNSELGADPEFLALMHFLGSKRMMDALSGAGEGGGGNGADPNGIEGLSKMW